MGKGEFKSYMGQYAFQFFEDVNVQDKIKKVSGNKNFDDVRENLIDVIISFNELEDNINILIAELLHERTHQVGFIVIANLSVQQKIDLLENMPEHIKCRNEELPKDERISVPIKKLFYELKHINRERNKIAHSLPFQDRLDMDDECEDIFFVRTKLGRDKKGVYGMFKILTVEIISDLINRIENITEEIQKLQI